MTSNPRHDPDSTRATSGVQNLFAAWAAIGATMHLCLPTLHHAVTPVGHPALWLWLLPAAAWALCQLSPRAAEPGMTVVTPRTQPRPRGRATLTRGSRRLRRPMAAPPARRAG